MAFRMGSLDITGFDGPNSFRYVGDVRIVITDAVTDREVRAVLVQPQVMHLAGIGLIHVSFELHYRSLRIKYLRGQTRRIFQSSGCMLFRI